MSGIKIILWTILLCAVINVNAHYSCTTPDGKDGECKSIFECPVLYNLANKPNKTERQEQYLLGFKCPGERHIFCCEKPKPKPLPKPQGQSCYTPDGIRGNCVPRQNCDQIMKNTNKFIMDSFCPGREIVCCGETPRPVIKRGVCTASAFPPDPATGCCGVQVALENKIIGGNVASIDEYPWVGIIKYKNGKQLCGGSLISSRYVLTAAHCVYDQTRNIPVNVTFGEHDTANDYDCEYINQQPDCADPPVTIPIEHIIIHPEYNPTDPYLRNDIALVRLAQAAPYTEFIRPICLPSPAEDIFKNPPKNLTLTATGWGTSDKKHSFTSLKMKVTLPFVGQQECSRVYSSREPPVALWSYQLCAGGEKLKDTCTGDSGGPLMYSGIGNQYQVIGIVSFGTTECGIENTPGVYTKVSAYNTWIRRNIRP